MDTINLTRDKFIILNICLLTIDNCQLPIDKQQGKKKRDVNRHRASLHLIISTIETRDVGDDCILDVGRMLASADYVIPSLFWSSHVINTLDCASSAATSVKRLEANDLEEPFLIVESERKHRDSGFTTNDAGVGKDIANLVYDDITH